MEKGKTNNPNGRPKGSPNKITGELRESMKTFLDGNFKLIVRDFKKLKPEKRIELYERFLKYVLPTLSSTDISMNIEKMSDEEVSQILNRLINKENEEIE